MSQMHLTIVTPEKEIYNEDVDMVTVPSVEGELGILPHHVNLMSKLAPGELQIKKSGKTEILAIGDGFMQITNNSVTILTDLAVDEKDLDERALEDAKKRAEQALSQTQTDEDHVELMAILEKTLAQLKVKRRHHIR